MKIHEATRADGSFAPTHLQVVDGGLVVAMDGREVALADGVLARVMARYGAPLEDGARLSEVDVLELGEGSRLRHVRHLACYDVIAKDWLIYEAPGEEPICALANTVAGALAHLARVAAEMPDPGS